MLHDKIAIVTGASRGIGRAIALILAELGCHVVCAARSLSALEKTAESVRNLGREALAVATDMTDKTSILALVEKTLDRFGKIDLLVNNAGGPIAYTQPPRPKSQDEFFACMDRYSFVNCDETAWEQIFFLNFTGPRILIKAVLPHMIVQNGGQIINITSKSGKMKHMVVPGMGAYASAKAALSRFTEVLAFELMCAGHRIRVNAISPGMIAVSIHQQLPDEERSVFGRPEDIKNVLMRLLDEKNQMNGEIIASDSGLSWYDEIQKDS